MEQKKRIGVWDMWKGIAIISVILIHSTGYASNFTLDNFNLNTALYLRQFINFPVAMFLFISGYFSAHTENSNFIESISKRLRRILPPYITWSILYLVLYHIVFNRDIGLKKILSGLLLGNAIPIGYFVVLLIQFIFLSHLYSLIKNPKTHLSLIFTTTVIGFIYTYSTRFFIPDGILTTFPFSAIPFFVWYPFFHVGYYISRYKVNIKIRMKTLLILMTLCIFMSIIEASYISPRLGYDFASSQTKLTSILTSFILCLLVVKTINFNMRSRLLEWLGKKSFGIYLIHIYIVTKTIAILQKTYIYQEAPLIAFLITTSIALFISLLIIQSIQIVFGKKIASFIVG
ncbi:acyltransferase [Raoultella terrigena]|uniref:acyltransferase n=1 Tax=Raoultella terrigena TaxID=577 RepID=UPI001F52131E|nr:acyltransferase [Raoultella terrigena]MCI1030806.1 acyltransferase [Raoultella terrigena]